MYHTYVETVAESRKTNFETWVLIYVSFGGLVRGHKSHTIH